MTGKKYSAEISEVYAAHGFARLNLGNTDLDGDLGIPGQTLCRVENYPSLTAQDTRARCCGAGPSSRLWSLSRHMCHH